MKKIISLVLSVCLLCALFVTPAFAGAAYNSDVTISASLDKSELSVSSSAQTVVLTVSTSKAVDLFSIGYSVAIPEGWSINSISSGSMINYSDYSSTTTGVVSWFDPMAKNKSASTIGVISVSVPANTPAGNYSIGVSGVELATEGQNNDNAWMTSGSASAQLTIKAPKVLTGISVKTAPTKTSYIAGQNFDPAGLVITATYNDGTTADKTSGWTITDGNNLTTGKTSVTISYTEGSVTMTTTCSVTVEKSSTPIIPPTTDQYSIDAPSNVQNGSVTVNKVKAEVGSLVTITVTPNDGYVLDTLTVKDAKGNALTLTKVSDTTYTFKMPASKVTISATFVKDGTCALDDTCPATKFTDLDLTAWYHDGVHFCVENDLIQGYPGNLFGPADTLTRAQIVTILWRMEGCPSAEKQMSFDDVNGSAWFADAIRWAQSTGIVKGYSDDAFGPNDNVTREQLVSILYRYADYKGIDVSRRATLSDFTDAGNISDWAVDSMKWAVDIGMIKGRTETTIAPKDDTTRAEAATMIQRFCEKIL